MHLKLEIEQETDGRWIAEIVDLPGVMVYGATPDEAASKAKALAFRVLADGLEHGESVSDLSTVTSTPHGAIAAAHSHLPGK